jgi:hypothetical protein
MCTCMRASVCILNATQISFSCLLIKPWCSCPCQGHCLKRWFPPPDFTFNSHSMTHSNIFRLPTVNTTGAPYSKHFRLGHWASHILTLLCMFMFASVAYSRIRRWWQWSSLALASREDECFSAFKRCIQPQPVTNTVFKFWISFWQWQYGKFEGTCLLSVRTYGK